MLFIRELMLTLMRFYFRPHTQTQFYNEYLGVDIDMGYDKDGDGILGMIKRIDYWTFPKCPKPIYFEFPCKRFYLGCSKMLY